MSSNPVNVRWALCDQQATVSHYVPIDSADVGPSRISQFSLKTGKLVSAPCKLGDPD